MIECEQEKFRVLGLLSLTQMCFYEFVHTGIHTFNNLNTCLPILILVLNLLTHFGDPNGMHFLFATILIRSLAGGQMAVEIRLFS